MRFAVLLLCVCCRQCAGDFVVPEPQIEFFNQTFDHFNHSDTRSWKQQVLIYDKYWIANGSSTSAPLFIICGGEAPVRGGYNHDGLVFELAAQFGAVIVAPEHRFYGESLPFAANDSYLPPNLARLTVQQSLQDYANVLETIKQRYKLSASSKVLSAGGSYPGELASYMRMNQMVDFALASSAPVKYRPFLADGTPSGAFFQTTTEVFGKVDSRCPQIVRLAFEEIFGLAKTSGGREQISEQLGLCSGTFETVDLLQLWIESGFATLVMENYPFAVAPFPAWPMKRMLKETAEPVAALKAALSVVYNTTDDVKCHNVRDEYLECSDITGCGLGTDGRSWDYQFCTQVNSNVDTNNVTDMFPARPFDFGALSAYCNKTFGVVPRPRELPGLFPPLSGDHIIYANGDIDGWFMGGLLESRPGDEVWSVNVSLGAHHLDLRGDTQLDTEGARRARQQERLIVTRWLTESPAELFQLHSVDKEDHKCFEATSASKFVSKGITDSGGCPASYNTVDKTVTVEQCPDGVTSIRYCSPINVTITTKGVAVASGGQFCCKEVGPNKVKKCVGAGDGKGCVGKICPTFGACEHTCKNIDDSEATGSEGQFCCKEVGPNKVKKCVGTGNEKGCVGKICPTFGACEHTCKNIDDSEAFSFMNEYWKHHNTSTTTWLHAVPAKDPKEIDWVTKGAVTQPTSQGRCATCQSFSCIADVEGAWFTSGHPLVKLSEQEMIDCAGGDAYGMKWILQNGGVATNADAPLANHSDPNLTGCRGVTDCKAAESKSGVFINGTTCLTNHDENNILALLQHGPMSVSIDAGPLGGYNGGVINCTGSGVDHAVTLVAFGTDADTGESYWTIKNSWGPDFGESSPPGRTGKGEKGYARLKFGNTCLRGPCQAYVGNAPWE